MPDNLQPIRHQEWPQPIDRWIQRHNQNSCPRKMEIHPQYQRQHGEAARIGHHGWKDSTPVLLGHIRIVRNLSTNRKPEEVSSSESKNQFSLFLAQFQTQSKTWNKMNTDSNFLAFLWRIDVLRIWNWKITAHVMRTGTAIFSDGHIINEAIGFGWNESCPYKNTLTHM